MRCSYKTQKIWKYSPTWSCNHWWLILVFWLNKRQTICQLSKRLTPCWVVSALLAFLTAAFMHVCRYEGTGRSLSLKLIQQLRQQSADSQQSMSAENRTANTARLAAGKHLPVPPRARSVCASLIACLIARLCLYTARSLHEVSLHESIRYAPGDPVEKWLNDLLCLDCLNIPRLISGCPLPQTCDLYP